MKIHKSGDSSGAVLTPCLSLDENDERHARPLFASVPHPLLFIIAFIVQYAFSLVRRFNRGKPFQGAVGHGFGALNLRIGDNRC